MPKNPLRFRADLRRIEAGGEGYIDIVLRVQRVGPVRKLTQQIGESFSVLMLDDQDEPAPDEAAPA